jgi:polyferredoxin
MVKRKKIKNIGRKALQWLVMGLLGYMIIRLWVDPNYFPDFEAYCPFGGLQAFTSFFVNNSLACSMTETQIFMGVVLAVGAVVFSKLFCSYICPIGTVTEWLGRIGNRFNVRYQIKGLADRLLRSLKYILLFVTVYFTVTSSELFCKEYDPYYAIVTGFGHDVVFWYAIIALAVTILGAVFIRQFWCKYVCPLGALTNIFTNAVVFAGILVVYLFLLYFGVNISFVWPLAAMSILGYALEATQLKAWLFPVFKITRNADTCTSCGLCDKACPMGLDVATVDTVEHIDCHLCGDCVAVCPVNDTLQINKRNWKWLPSVATVGLILVGLFLASDIELPTINLEWGKGTSAQNVAVYSQSGLKSVKCYGSSMSFANRMRRVRGVVGVQTYVQSHTVKVFYDSTKIISADNSGVVKFWGINSGKELVSLYPVSDSEYVAVTPAGLFDGSEKALQNIHFTVGTEVIPLQQIKDRYYEPELLKKILAGEGVRDVEQVNFDKMYPSVWTSDINTTSGQMLVILTARTGGIGKVQVLVNGKEWLADARPNGERDAEKDKVKVMLNLSECPYLIPQTDNIITVKAYNSDNWLYGRPVVKHYYAMGNETHKPNMYLLIIGTSDYYLGNLDLNYADDDAIAIARALTLGGENLFGKENTHLYLLVSPLQDIKEVEEDTILLSTKTNILSILDSIAAHSEPTDVFVMYMAGHGTNKVIDDNPEFYYLARNTYSTNFDDPAILSECTVSTTELVESLKKIKALKQVLIIDACHSGQLSDIIMFARDRSDAIRALDRMKDRTGVHILTSSQASQVSYESGRYGQGLLTYSLLEGIKGMTLREGKYLDVMSWLQYSRDRVPVLAKEIHGYQTPKLISPLGSESFDIGIFEEAEQSQIPIATPKPVFVRSNLFESSSFSDILGLSDTLNNTLSEINSRGAEADVLFSQASNFSEAYKFNGIYSVKNNKIEVNVSLLKGSEVIETFKVTGNKQDIKALSDEIINSGLEKIKSLEEKTSE